MSYKETDSSNGGPSGSFPTVTAGRPDAPGATCDDTGVNFTLFSAHAQKVELCLFADDGITEIVRIPLPEKTGDIFHGHVSGLKAGQIYGYRVSGKNDPAQGNLFNPNKLLLDPYAKEIIGAVQWTQAHHDPAADTAGVTPKARVTAPVQKSATPKPNRAMKDSIIYEMHVKGFSTLDPGVPEDKRGTYAGLASPSSIAYLKELGITAVELLPVHTKVDDEFLVQQGLSNYWGYMTLGFFAPEPSYAADRNNAPQEFRDMVDTLHKNDIEVILDVVYNHTPEGTAQSGPMLSLRGIDNASYYKTTPGAPSKDIDDTGCANTLDIASPACRRLVIESLRHWVEEYGVDGFRFDLASVLGRDPYNFTAAAAFFQDIQNDPALSKIKLIAEPWDIGPNGYQLGKFPTLWSEWNDKFRNGLRKFWRQDTHMLATLATLLAGSSPQFDHDGRTPQASINFFACHDGFTAEDLVSYNTKHNEANGPGNNGSDDNLSTNHGIEGETKDAAVLAARAQQKRNMLATLFLAQGTPMLLAGDEHGNTQGGNNNAYCQDNLVSWLDRTSLSQEDKDLQSFTRKLIEFRKNHQSLTTPRYLHGLARDADGVKDISWHNAEGRERTEQDWAKNEGQCLAMMLNARAIAPDAQNPKKGERLLTIFNAASTSTDFILPEAAGGGVWERVIDTSSSTGTPAGTTTYAQKISCSIPAQSTVVFVQKNI